MIDNAQYIFSTFFIVFQIPVYYKKDVNWDIGLTINGKYFKFMILETACVCVWLATAANMDKMSSYPDVDDTKINACEIKQEVKYETMDHYGTQRAIHDINQYQNRDGLKQEFFHKDWAQFIDVVKDEIVVKSESECSSKKRKTDDTDIKLSHNKHLKQEFFHKEWQSMIDPGVSVKDEFTVKCENKSKPITVVEPLKQECVQSGDGFLFPKLEPTWQGLSPDVSTPRTSLV